MKMTPDERRERIKIWLKEIEKRRSFLEKNGKKLDIYDGNLFPYVDEVMKKTLSPEYYDKIKSRLVLINILTRVIDKLSKVYSKAPMRVDQKYKDFIQSFEDEAGLNVQMGLADSYSNLFKGYALEPYLDEGKKQIRVLAYDQFIPMSMNKTNPTKMTDFIKIMGECDKKVKGKNTKCKLYFGYTDFDFVAFTDDGEECQEYYEKNDGENIYGRIPVVYGNRSLNSLIPTQDTDIDQMAVMIPVLLSDLAGAVMFQCFTIMYGINLKVDNPKMSPNAFWNLKADNKADGAPSVGTIKPEADIDKVITFIKSIFAFWLESKGVRIGSMNNIDSNNLASGISKIIDEMDVYEIKKVSIQFFKKEEKELWDLLKVMNNVWIEDPLYKGTPIGDDYAPVITFDEPSPEISRDSQFNTIDKEYKGGYLPADEAIKQLYPDLNDDQVAERALELDKVNSRNQPVEKKSTDENKDESKDEEEKDADAIDTDMGEDGDRAAE